MEFGVSSNDGTEQDHGNIVGVKHENRVNDQPVFANESDSLFIESAETVHHKPHIPTEMDASMNVVTEQLGNPQTSIAKSRKRAARVPRESEIDYQTNHYPIYDPTIDNRGPSVTSAFSTYGKYDKYALYMNPHLDASDANQIAKIPRSGVRLDDLTISNVLLSSLRRYEIPRYWQSESDTNVMVRATRMPLGHAAKEFKNVGDADIDENILAEGQQGWYYL
ncbi:MAG: hypothetical protein Q9194_007189 [Teloschistes cf. exilis]